MTRNHQDAARKGSNGKRAANGGAGERLSAARVADYLREHPGFFLKHADLLEVMDAPARANGERVVDLQQYMVERLRNELTDMAAARDDLVATGRNNLSTQSRVHKGILSLLSARSFEHFVETLTTDLTVILDLDVVTVGVERNGDGPSRAQTAGVFQLEPKTVDHLLGPGQQILLRPEATGDPAIFGPGAGLVCSDALIRLTISSKTPAALLALGSRQPEQFHPGQGTELLSFLARVVESCIRGWLNLPE